ncbi:MAG: hypothetical protein WAW86_07375 [Gammaproteobacteria bacterium]
MSESRQQQDTSIIVEEDPLIFPDHPHDIESLQSTELPSRYKLNKLSQALVGTTMLVNAVCIAGLNTTSLHSMHYPLPFALTSASISIFTELGLSQKFTVPGIDEIASMVKHKSLPNKEQDQEEWPTDLPYTTEIAALALGLFCTGVSAYHYGGQIYFWARTIPDEQNYRFAQAINPLAWKIFSGFCAGSVVTNLICGQGLETIKAFRRRLSGKLPLTYTSFRDIFSLSVGNLLIGIPYVTAVSLMNIQGSIEAQPFFKLSPSLFTTMALTIADASGNYCLNGLFIPQIIHNVLTQFTHNDAINYKQIISLSIALTLSGLHTYTQYTMAASTLETLSKNLNIYSAATTWIASLLSILYAEGEFITSSQTLYNGAYAMLDWATQRDKKNTPAPEHAGENTPLLGKKPSLTQISLFANAAINDDTPEDIAAKQSKCRCTIL